MAELITRDGELVPAGHPTGWSIALGVGMVLAGILAIAAPFFAGVAVTIFLGYLVLFGGIAHFAYAWSERSTGATVLQVLIGLVYLVAAYYLIVHPRSSVVTLTLILALYIGFEGVLEIALYFRLRSLQRSGFFLLDGLVSLLLAVLILVHWPSSSLWAVGTLVGVSLIFSGIARFSVPAGRRRSAMVLPI